MPIRWWCLRWLNGQLTEFVYVLYYWSSQCLDWTNSITVLLKCVYLVVRHYEWCAHMLPMKLMFTMALWECDTFTKTLSALFNTATSCRLQNIRLTHTRLILLLFVIHLQICRLRLHLQLQWITMKLKTLTWVSCLLLYSSIMCLLMILITCRSAATISSTEIQYGA